MNATIHQPEAALRAGEPSDRHRPRYHLTAPSGWINDPNGVGFHHGRYHVFYQYNPDAPRWDCVHWGHASSADLVHWRDEPIALAPSPGDDADGCFSGSFALVGGQPTLYYTGCTLERQVLCVATSGDMQTWTKQPARTIRERPAGVHPQDFRDPYVFQHGGWWYLVVGASADHARGQALLYRSADGVDWAWRHPLFTSPSPTLGVVWECPNFFQLDGKWVLTVAVWPNLGAHYFVGRFEDERFIAEADGVLDPDSGAFAHLAMQAPDGRTLQWAWINEQREQPLIDADGWCGALTVPRELTLDPRQRLLMRPAADLHALRGAPVPIAATGATRGELYRFQGRCLDIEARFTLHDHHKVALTVLAAPDGSEATRIEYWPDARRLTVVRARSAISRQVSHQNVVGHLALDAGEPLRLRVLLDHSVLEVYANERLCLTTRIYPTLPASRHGSVSIEGHAEASLHAWAMGGIHLDRQTTKKPETKHVRNPIQEHQQDLRRQPARGDPQRQPADRRS